MNAQGQNSKFQFYLLIGVGVLTSLVIIYYLEKLAYKLINLLVYFDTLTVVIIFLLHALLVRFIATIFIFPGANFLIKKLIRYENGKIPANQYLKIFTLFKNYLQLLNSNSQLALTSVILRSMRTSIFL
jgi:hypothetical protein